MDSIIRPHLDEEKRKMVFQVKEEATESAINAVRIRLKVEAEAAAAEGNTIGVFYLSHTEKIRTDIDVWLLSKIASQGIQLRSL